MALVTAGHPSNEQLQRKVVMLPDDPRARLMYYINCVGKLLDLEGINPLMDRLQMYNAYIDIGGPTLTTLLNLAVLLRPENLFGSCLFVNDDLCTNANASFLIMEKSEIAQALNITVDGVHVQGGMHKVNNIMVVQKVWLIVHFYSPFIVLSEILQAQIERENAIKKDSESCACALL